ncbi:MAG: 4-hydroxy-tetrahydrodipicolinate synthase [Acidobacteriota bacterium]
MNTEKFRGTTVALVTPFNDDASLDEESLKALVEWQIQQGTDAILAAGTTGEAATLSMEEHEHLMELICGQVAGRVPVVCGAGSNCTREALFLTRCAEGSGADAILSVGPYYNKPTQEGFYRHFREIADSTDLPIMIYNVPGRTGSNISAETTLRLAEISNIIAVKEASGNISQISEIIRDRPEGFLVLSGDDCLALPLMSLGSEGVVSVAANQVPGLLKQMVSAVFAGNWEKAREIHFRLFPLMETNFIESNPIPVKTSLAMMGMLKDNFRLPMTRATEKTREKLSEILKDLELI